MGATDRHRLNSWKAIAAYLDRSVRTVRRWEAGEGLPVHRQMHARQGSVYAFREEIDRWLRSRSQGPQHVARPADAAPVLAVLPFESIGSDEELPYLADGFGEELLSDLARSGSLRVLSRTSSRRLGRDRIDARGIGRRHGVTHLVEGSVRSASAQIRVGIRLIEIDSDSSVWSEVFDGGMDELFELQSRVSRATASALSARLGCTMEIPDRALLPAAVWRCLAVARQQSLKWRREAIDDAVRELESCIDAFGDSAELLAALGRAHLQYRESGLDLGPAPIEKAMSVADRLARIAPDHAATFQLRGWIHYAAGRVVEAIDALAAADRRQPSDPETLGLLVNCLLISDRGGEAIAHIDRLLRIDPLTPLTVCLPGWYRLLEGDYDGALPYYQAMLERDPANPMARLFNVWVLATTGRTCEAIDLAAGAETGESASVPERVTAFLGDACAGRTNQAHARLDDHVRAQACTSDMLARFLAAGFAMLDDAETSVRWLAVAVDCGFTHYPFLAERDPLLEGVRSHVQFSELLERVRAVWVHRHR